MQPLLLVRHGQASLGSEDYDRLSPLGERQCVQLGRWMAERHSGFSAVLTGRLRRHRQSLEAFAIGWGRPLPQATVHAELDEYDSEALIRCVSAGPLVRPDSPEAARQHFRQLRQALLAWMDGAIAPEGMPVHADFVAGLRRVADRAAEQARPDGGPVLVFSSGGPISNLLGALMGTPHASTVDLNLRLRNASVSELLPTRRGFSVQAFNSVAHLDHPDMAGWITHA